MENYILILIGGVISMIVGSIWYGPLFGKKWMEICGVTEMDIEKRKQMQKAALPLYATQFLLTLLQLFILSIFIVPVLEQVKYCRIQDVSCPGIYSIIISCLVWLGFIMPTIAGSAMWNNDPTKVKWARFLIQSGYQLVMFLIFGWMIMTWM